MRHAHHRDLTDRRALALVLNSRCTSGSATGNIAVFSGLSMAATATVPTAGRADGPIPGGFVGRCLNLMPSSMGLRL
jgi:hypothetical protein